MKISIAIEILKEIKRSNGKTTMTKLSREFRLSVRTIGRYLEELIVSGVPLSIYRGPKGGVRLEGEIL